jgi:hypothetical protein
MSDWHVYGRVMAMRRSSDGLRLVLDSRRMEFNTFHSSARQFPLMRCPDAALCDQLESQLRVGDLAHMAGTTAPITRPQSHWLKRDWEMIVTEARVPRLLNAWRRICMRPLETDDTDLDDQSSSSSSS